MDIPVGCLHLVAFKVCVITNPSWNEIGCGQAIRTKTLRNPREPLDVSILCALTILTLQETYFISMYDSSIFAGYMFLVVIYGAPVVTWELLGAGWRAKFNRQSTSAIRNIIKPNPSKNNSAHAHG